MHTPSLNWIEWKGFPMMVGNLTFSVIFWPAENGQCGPKVNQFWRLTEQVCIPRLKWMEWSALQIWAETTLGPISISRQSFLGMGIPMFKIRRYRDNLIFNMGIPMLVRHLYSEMAPWCPYYNQMRSVNMTTFMGPLWRWLSVNRLRQ